MSGEGGSLGGDGDGGREPSRESGGTFGGVRGRGVEGEIVVAFSLVRGARICGENGGRGMEGCGYF